VRKGERTSRIGKYNRSYTHCIECEGRQTVEGKIADTVGFGEPPHWNIVDKVLAWVWVCRLCGQRQWSHASEAMLHVWQRHKEATPEDEDEKEN